MRYNFALTITICLACSMAENARSQEPKPSASEVTTALQDVRAGNFTGIYVDALGQAGATDALPDLEKLFAKTTDPMDKAKIAQVLVQLHDSHDSYWEYLSGLAKKVIDEDAPDPLERNSSGSTTGQMAPAFKTWALANKLEPELAAQDALFAQPAIFKLLAITEDRRAIPYLRKAIDSKNYLVQAAAVRGLAEFQDDSSVSAILAACDKAPPDASRLMARSLIYFSDSRAQSEADRRLPKNEVTQLREKKAKGATPFR